MQECNRKSTDAEAFFFFFITCGCDNRVLIFLLILILWRGYFLLPDSMENTWNNFQRYGIQKSYHMGFQCVYCLLPRGGTLKYLSYSNTNQAPAPPPKLNLSLDIKLTRQVRPVLINRYLFHLFFSPLSIFGCTRSLCAGCFLGAVYRLLIEVASTGIEHRL